MFLVISGFVLPYSLFKAGYRPSVRNFGRFLWKRLSRLEPPYLISVALMLVLMAPSHLLPWLSGTSPTISVNQVLLHFGYLNNYFHQEWLNPVYWTLALEFQYYILIGILYPFVSDRRAWVRMLTWCGFALFAYGDRFFGLGHWLFIFMLGFAVFQYQVRIVGQTEFLCALAFSIVGCVATLGKSVTLVGVLACLGILFLRRSYKLTALLGDLSYSFYLIHLPVGGLVFSLAATWSEGLFARLATLAAAISISLALSYVLYYFVERPCRKYASSVHFEQI